MPGRPCRVIRLRFRARDFGVSLAVLSIAPRACADIFSLVAGYRGSTMQRSESRSQKAIDGRDGWR